MQRRRRVLIVDDDAGVRTSVRAAMEGAGYEVTTARNGYEAISLIAASDYDLVLLDVVMPKLDGLGVVDALRKNNIGVLAHTYLLAIGDSDQLAHLPVRGIIVKPFNIHRLVAEAKDCIGH